MLQSFYSFYLLLSRFVSFTFAIKRSNSYAIAAWYMKKQPGNIFSSPSQMKETATNKYLAVYFAFMTGFIILPGINKIF
jgi:hypothetical protein